MDEGVDPSAQANVGQTALHLAAHSGYLETVRMLIARKAPLEVINMYGGTVLGQALWSADFLKQKQTRASLTPARWSSDAQAPYFQTKA